MVVHQLMQSLGFPLQIRKMLFTDLIALKMKILTGDDIYRTARGR